MAKQKKEQQSSVDRLPKEVKQQLDADLRDKAVNQLEATARANELLEEKGHADRLSKSSVNRYYQRMREAGAKLRQSREVAEMWIGKLGASPQGQVGNLVNEILRTLSFDMALILQDGEIKPESMPAVVDMLKGLSLTMQRLERAANLNVKREQEIRKQALEDAADVVAKEVREGGMEGKDAAWWRETVLGIR